jgi:hypothetical protein
MESPALKQIFSWSAIVRYAVISAINLAIVLLGIALGVILAPHIEKPVGAQNPTPAATSHDLEGIQAVGPVTTNAAGQKVTPIAPGMQVGTVGIYLILAHRVESDQLVVNGYDLLKLQNSQLSMLSRFVPASEIQKAVEDAKVPELYTVGNTATPPTPSPTNKPK